MIKGNVNIHSEMKIFKTRQWWNSSQAFLSNLEYYHQVAANNDYSLKDAVIHLLKLLLMKHSQVQPCRYEDITRPYPRVLSTFIYKKDTWNICVWLYLGCGLHCFIVNHLGFTLGEEKQNWDILKN